MLMEGLQPENKTPEEQKKELSAKIESIFKETQIKVDQIKKFEEIISTRFYFHFKEQSEEHLQNWHAYIDFILTQKDHKRIVSVFERCLVPCVNTRFFFFTFNITFYKNLFIYHLPYISLSSFIFLRHIFNSFHISFLITFKYLFFISSHFNPQKFNTFLSLIPNKYFFFFYNSILKIKKIKYLYLYYTLFYISNK